MTRYALFLALCVALAGCGGGPLSLLTGGGPNVAANTQAGKTNNQTVGKTEIKEQRITRAEATRDVVQSSDTSRVKADRVETVVVQEYPVWLIIAFAAALFLDSPLRWPEQIIAAFRRKAV
jgi:hypothetical protein